MIRNIVFDMGDVLMHFRPLEACRALLADETDAQVLFNAYFGGPEWAEVDRGGLDGDAFTQTVKALLPQRLHPAVDTLYRGMPENVLFPIDGMAELIDGLLQRDMHLYLLSNAGHFMHRRQDVIPRIDRFHGVLFSSQKGIVKPDHRLYRQFESRFGLKSEECLFIDDRDDNVQAAIDCGWQAYRFQGNVQALQRHLEAL